MSVSKRNAIQAFKLKGSSERIANCAADASQGLNLAPKDGAMIYLLLLIPPSLSPVAISHCYEIERNDVYDDSGEIVLRQLIFRDWDAPDYMHEIVAWCWLRQVKTPPSPRRGGGWCVTIQDEDGRLRVIRAERYYRTVSNYDRELAERKWWPVKRRKGWK